MNIIDYLITKEKPEDLDLINLARLINRYTNFPGEIEIQNDLENPISEMLLKYNISRGSKISVKVVKNKLVFDYQVSKNIKSNISKKVKISVKKDNK